jgi:hypothetical protein
MSRILPNHPDMGMWVSDFTGLTQSAAGKEIDRFSFSDPRVSLVGEGTGPAQGVFEPDTLFTLIVPMHENVRWLHIFNGSSGEEMIAIDLGPAIRNYCNETNWVDDYCKTVDLNNNGIPDYKENWSDEEAAGVMKENAPEARSPEIEVESYVPYVPPKEPAGPAVPTEPEPAPEKPEVTNLTWLIIALVVVVIAAISYIAILKKGRKPGT